MSDTETGTITPFIDFMCVFVDANRQGRRAQVRVERQAMFIDEETVFLEACKQLYRGLKEDENVRAMSESADATQQ